MTEERGQQVKRLFEAALKKDSAARAGFFDILGEFDPELRKEVESLLASGEAPPSTRQTVPSTITIDKTTAIPGSSSPGRRIGPYRVKQEIGHGGMGAVYLATRNDAEFKRRVALKILRPGMVSNDVIRRFRNERQILAGIDHPYVAKLYDGGTTDEGLPYLVMEYIEGRRIDEYCDAQKLSIDERLELFRKVCSAVHFAHQNLVVHRDLKPGNILVSADGEPKLLDFGIAKLLNPELAEATIDPTRFETRLMTPEYASPEQVKGEPITTASDVYALGVLLYELLTGHRPYRLTSLELPEIARVICEDEPVRPSAVIHEVEEVAGPGGTSRITPETVAATRAGNAERLRRKLKGDLDSVVLKAMRKEPDHRYVSAEQLSEDIRRVLEELPVKARKGTFTYHSSKFIRRHKTALGAAAVMLLSLLGFTGFMVRERARAVEARERAEREAAKATAMNAFLQETLGSANPTEGMGRDTTVLEALEGAAGKIGSSFANQPEIEAAVRDTMGWTYMRLARYDQAESLVRSGLELRRKAAGERSVEVAESLTTLGGLMLYKGDYRAAEEHFRSALAMRRELLGEHREVGAALNNLALALSYQAENEEAAVLYREALSLRRRLLGERHPDVAETLNNLAYLLHDEGDYAAAEPLYREVLAIDLEHRGEKHPNVATDLDNLAGLLDDMGAAAEAEPLFREAFEMRRELLGEEHPDVAKSMNNLAMLLQKKGELQEAEALFREAVAMRRRISDAHPELATNIKNLATAVEAKGDLQEAEALYREAIAMYLATLDENHWRVATARYQFGNCLTQQKRYEEAEGYLLSAHAALVTGLGEKHARTRAAAEYLSSLYRDWGKPEKAAQYRVLLEQAEPP